MTQPPPPPPGTEPSCPPPSLGDEYLRTLRGEAMAEQLFMPIPAYELARLTEAVNLIVPADRDHRAGVMLRAALLLVDAARSFAISEPELQALMGHEPPSADPVDDVIWFVLTDRQGAFDFDPQALLSVAILNGSDSVIDRQMVLYGLAGWRIARHRGVL